jgi:hypothetical protein
MVSISLSKMNLRLLTSILISGTLAYREQMQILQLAQHPLIHFRTQVLTELHLLPTEVSNAQILLLPLAKVYPGFIPDFTVNGSCVLNPYQFIDRTTSKYGIVDSWHWDFGDLSTTADSSLIQKPNLSIQHSGKHLL